LAAARVEGGREDDDDEEKQIQARIEDVHAMLLRSSSLGQHGGARTTAAVTAVASHRGGSAAGQLLLLQCCICMEEVDVGLCVSCRPNGGERPHHTCLSCLCPYIGAEAVPGGTISGTQTC
jgi:hypothetical protein